MATDLKQMEITQQLETEEKGEINSILTNPNRINVDFCISIHNISASDNSDELRFHLVLKFYYNKKDMNYFMDPLYIPDDSITLKKEYGSMQRYFPYMLFNAVEETPINWSYHYMANDGRVYERVALFATLTNVVFSRYAPWILRILNIKVGTDGTYKTGLVNLVPKKKDGNPVIDWGIFLKDTSTFTLSNIGALGQPSINQLESDVFCKMFIRDLTIHSKGNLVGIYTRIYTCLFFQSPWYEDLFKFVVISQLLMFLLMFGLDLELGDLLGTNLTVILTEVAFLFVLPPTDEFTTSERVLTAHIIIMVFITILSTTQVLNQREHLLYIISGVALLTVAFVVWEWTKYRKLVKKLKSEFYSNNSDIGDYKPIDKII